jgi:hypothetical protein
MLISQPVIAGSSYDKAPKYPCNINKEIEHIQEISENPSAVYA